MKLLRASFFPFWPFLLSNGTLGQRGMFLEKYKAQIQNKVRNTDSSMAVPLKIGMTGTKPFFFYDGSIRGSDMLILQLLRKKLGFEYNLKAGMNFETIVKMVRI